MRPKILLGMSGGTDSSVAAFLLMDEGYEVIGVTFRFWEDGVNSHLEDAISLTKKLGIQHIIHDARIEFNALIVKYFIDEYLAGKTPFPCVKCNNELKWKLLIDMADKMGIDQVAMGHYAQICRENGKYFIVKGKDEDKDQSFFLWGLKQNQLKRIIFPLGEYIKSQVRKLALDRGFTYVAKKKDSLGTCFCSGDYRNFLKHQLKNPDEFIYQGNFIDESGKIIGQHNGYPLYTVGQRRGLIFLNRKVFVKEIKPLTNEVVLASLEAMYRESFYIHNTNFMSEELISSYTDIICKIRYRKQNTPCNITILAHGRAKVTLKEKLESVAPGQAAVFYIDEKIVGGGFIE